MHARERWARVVEDRNARQSNNNDNNSATRRSVLSSCGLELGCPRAAVLEHLSVTSPARHRSSPRHINFIYSTTPPPPSTAMFILVFSTDDGCCWRDIGSRDQIHLYQRGIGTIAIDIRLISLSRIGPQLWQTMFRRCARNCAFCPVNVILPFLLSGVFG